MQKFETKEAYEAAINSEPLEEMVKSNADGSKYIPISIIQKQLYAFFGHTHWEMLRENVHKSGISGVGVLRFKPPFLDEWVSVTGTAAISYKGGIRLDFPALEGHAILNAAKKIGVWFGRDLNRNIEDAPYQEEPVIDRAKLRLLDLINDSVTIEELAKHKELSLKYELTKEYMDKLKSLTK